ncbi:hypothetical protein [Nonomuraea sp. GTA35]|uniref:hypothetical protein n=1 Tax=Nonomuraea sp. GTA35 TaxID=1676746 RepID=UPI0035BF54CC
MRRSWVVAGVLILVAVPSVPVAAAGVSLVLERVGGADGVGKWVRTGDTQRFRVRLNGMGRGARVAVAASPVEALTKVACEPAPGRASRSGPEASGAPGTAAVTGPPAAASGTQPAPRAGTASHAGTASRVGTASVIGAVPKVTGTSHTGVAATLTMRALSVVGGAGVKGTAPPGTRVCALGKVSGERAVDITLKAPADTKEVVLAAVARVRDAESGGLTTMSRTAAVRAGEVITGDAATFAGPAHRLHPQRPGAVRPDGTKTRSGTPSQALPPRAGTAPAQATSTPARAPASPAPAQATPARAQATPARTRAARATPARAQATPARTRATPARARAASRRARAATVPPAAGSLVIPSTIPSVAPSVVPSAMPSVAPQGVTSGAVASVAPAPSADGAPQPAASGVPQASAPPAPSSGLWPAPAGGAPQASAGAFPQPLATAPGAVPSPSGAIVSFQPEAAGGEAPLPWGMAMSAKPVEPVRWVSPIDGPKALPMVVGGIGLLMAGLWAVVTVQRGRKRRKVL